MGSEMCIRDSLLGGGQGVLERLERRGRLGHADLLREAAVVVDALSLIHI